VEYVIIKWLHILSSTFLFGTGVGSAFLMFTANRSQNVRHMYFALRHVVIADWVFTAPSAAFQLASGLYLTRLGGFSLTNTWIAAALCLYVLIGACWLPVVWMQITMRDMAALALSKKKELPDRFWIYDRWWIILGSLAFPAMLVVFWLMVAKPA